MDAGLCFQLTIVWILNVLKGQCVEGLVFRLVLLRGGGTFRSWDLVKGAVPFKGMLDPAWWHTPLIPATQEAEVRGSEVQGQPQQLSKTLSQKKNRKNWGGSSGIKCPWIQFLSLSCFMKLVAFFHHTLLP